jgi:hypothetical protein
VCPDLTILRHVVAIGCVATILSFGFDPFIQNLIQDPIREVPDASQLAWVATALNYDITGPTPSGGESKNLVK